MKWPWQPVVEIVDEIIDLGDQFIVDKDKLIEFKFKAMELRMDAAKNLLGVKTHPFVDAIVKLMYAMQIFWRPVVGAAMTAFGAYCHFKGIEMDGALHAIFDGAFPAWATSRHVEKQRRDELKAGGKSWTWDEDDFS